mgnify:FL=1|jgi:hypothetical protein|tara:strand:- start:90 stop:266 length:177 start_codon:yes stop_codon:yes gene_type:complete
MTKVYDFDWHRLQKEDILRRSLGYTEDVWQLIKDSGYNVNSVIDREQFFKDLEDLDDD